MADILQLKFTKDWNSTDDFPSVEPDEGQARADMQALHDETRDYINRTLIPAIQNASVKEVYLDADGNVVVVHKNGDKATYDFSANCPVVKSLAVNASKELVVTFINGTTANLGKVGSSVTLSDSVSSSSSTTAASSKAVKTAYDAASEAKTAAEAAPAMQSGQGVIRSASISITASDVYWVRVGRIVHVVADFSFAEHQAAGTDLTFGCADLPSPSRSRAPGLSNAASKSGSAVLNDGNVIYCTVPYDLPAGHLFNLSFTYLAEK